MVDERFDKSLTSFLLNIALPCLIINSFNVPFSQEELKNCLILLLLSVGLLAVWFLIGQLSYKISGGGHWGRIVRFGAIFTNFSFVGIPVAEALYGQQGVLYFVVLCVPIRMVYYSAAAPMLSPTGKSMEKKSVLQHIRGWLSPPVIAVFIGLTLYISGISLPEVLSKTVSAIGSTCTTLGMILCGVSLGKNNLKALLKLRYLRMPILRNLVMPAITMGIMYLLPVDPLVKKTAVIYASLPVASMLAAFTIQYDPNPEAQLESAGSVFLSLLFFSATLPLWAKLTELLL